MAVKEQRVLTLSRLPRGPQPSPGDLVVLCLAFWLRYLNLIKKADSTSCVFQFSSEFKLW